MIVILVVDVHGAGTGERWMQAFDDERQRVATDSLSGFSVQDAMRRPVFTRRSSFHPHNAHSVFAKKPTKRVGVNRQKGAFDYKYT